MPPNENRNRALGAVLGAVVGVVGHWAMLRAGYHMAGVAGIGLALGVSPAARTPSLPWGLSTALLALAASLLTDWWFRPFLVDGSLRYYLAHVGELAPRSLASLVVAAGLGFWFGRGRRRGATTGPPA